MHIEAKIGIGEEYMLVQWERNKTIYRISIEEIIKIFKLVGKDYPHSST
jgi:hypothetical protein